MGFDTQDLLRQAGVSKGSFVPLFTFGSNGSLDFSASSSTFADSSAFVFREGNFADFLPDDAPLLAGFTGRTQDVVDADADIRLREDVSGQTLAGPITVKQGSTFQPFSAGPEEAPEFSNPAQLILQLRSDGTNTVEIELATAFIGIEV